MKHAVGFFVALVTMLGLASANAQVPPIPTDLTAQIVRMNTMEIRLQWQAPAGPWRFKIYRSVNDTDHFTPIGTTGIREFHDRLVWPGNTYYYFVTSYTTQPPVVESPRSNLAQATLGVPVPRPKGTIAGTVTDDSTSAPISHVRMRFFRLSVIGTMTPYTFTDSLGHYHALLDTGTYIVKAEPLCMTPNTLCYRPEFYNNSPDPQGATPIAVAESSLFVADFGLSRPTPPTYAYIFGRVTDTTGVPLTHASVAIIRTIQEMNYLAATTGQIPGLGTETMELDGVGHTRGVVWRGWTDSLGNYRARVASGRSYIALASKQGYLPEYFDNKTNPLEADIIHISGDTSGIDFSLSLNPTLQNSISGIVRDSLGTRVPSRVVLLPVRHGPMPNVVRFGHTDSLGQYTINGVRTGNYFVLAVPFSNYAPAFYKEGEYGVMRWSEADTVAANGNVTGIDIGVVPIRSNGIARLSGQVRSAAGGALAGVSIIATSAEGLVEGVGVSDARGLYTIDAVRPGLIGVMADRERYMSGETTVGIAGEATTISNIDFILAPVALTSSGRDTPVVRQYVLDQNYPNPFNPSTTIRFTLPHSGAATVRVFNLLGQEVTTLLNGALPAGTHAVVWDGSDSRGRFVSSGIYFYKLTASQSAGVEFSQIKKMIFLR